MRESTKVTKGENEKARSSMGVRINFSREATSTELTTEHVSENFRGGDCPVALPLIAILPRAANVWDLVQSDQ